MFDRRVMTSMYARATRAEDLPWHQDEPPRLLVRAASQHPRGRRALDVGCGAGTYAIYLAKLGFQVTGLDTIPRALELAGERARAEGATIELVDADLFGWEPPAPFDLVLDSGCLHSLIGGDPKRYETRLRGWLAVGGDFVLGHWGKRHALDWRPMGPRRRTRQELVTLFSTLEEHAHEESLMTGVPMPFGPTVLGLSLWFKRPG